MKKVIAIFLSMVLISILCSCAVNSETMYCNGCGEEVKYGFTYCPYCGYQFAADMVGEYDEDLLNQSPDYSDFGFINNFGMTEYLGIDSWDFDDKDNAYVSIIFNANETCSYSIISMGDTFLTEYEFTKGLDFTGDVADATLKPYYNEYNIINNKLLNEPYGASYTSTQISKVTIDRGIPILSMSTGGTTFGPKNYFIPTYFLDTDDPYFIIWHSKKIENYVFHYVMFKIKPELLEQ